MRTVDIRFGLHPPIVSSVSSLAYLPLHLCGADQATIAQRTAVATNGRMQHLEVGGRDAFPQ